MQSDPFEALAFLWLMRDKGIHCSSLSPGRGGAPMLCPLLKRLESCGHR